MIKYMMLATLLTALSSEMVSLFPDKPKAYAILIATKSIDKPAVSKVITKNNTDLIEYGSLGFVDPDISNIMAVLDISGFKKDDIINLTKKGLTLSEVRQAFITMAQKVKKNDLLFVYFTGHGDQIEDKDKEEPDGLDEVLVLHDNILVDDEVNRLMKMFDKNARKVLMVDACHSGTTNRLVETYREQLAKKSDRNFEQENKTLSITIPGQACTVTRNTSDAAEKNSVYIGACADDQKAKASNSGSFFTASFTSLFIPTNTSLGLNYRNFFCLLKSSLNIPGQTVHYEESADANFTISDHFLKK